jgi:hypothetical protein
MQQHFQAIVTVLSLVNPLICGPMFAQIEAGQTSFADATKAALTVLVILVIAALVGAIENGMRREGLRVVQFANEAFKDVLKKHGQPTGLMASSRESVDKPPKRKGPKQRKSG